MRKGQTYGTILVDLEQHRPIDLSIAARQWFSRTFGEGSGVACHGRRIASLAG
jgi:hypothetical protein